MRKIIFSIIGIFFSSLLTLLVIEIILRFFPVNEGLRAISVNSNSPVFKFQSNRVAQYSKNWNFDIKNKVSVNNDGFINNLNYDNKSDSLLLSLIGDSYIEALMVPFKQTVTSILQQNSDDKRVYSFAASGAGLSQHLIWAKYAKHKFNSDYFVFFIISNDFAESLADYEVSPGFHRFKRKEENKWEMELAEYSPSLTRRVLRHSRLAMYLITNLKVQSLLNLDLKLGRNDERITYVSNFRSDFNKKFWSDATWATKVYLDNVKNFTNVSEKNILFVIDGIRPELYNNKNNKEIEKSFWYLIRKFFIQEAKKRKFEVIDMQEKFISHYKNNREKFEFLTDSHWNQTGHKVVADSVQETNFWKNFRYDKNIFP